MHRFRKKSDAKRSQIPAETSPALLPVPGARGKLPTLPPASDFRTSLILPDLSRRFSLLRSSTGEPISLDDMRQRFAEQRAKGATNTISEEEEDMLFEALRKMHTNTSGFAKSGDGSSGSFMNAPSSAPYSTPDFGQADIRQSVQSTSSLGNDTNSLGASPGNRNSKRHSNNLFGSGQFRDLRYMRQASRNSSTRSVLTTTSEATTGSGANISGYTYTDSLRPITPDNSSSAASTASTPNEKAPGPRSAPLLPSQPFEGLSASLTELRFTKPLTKMQLKRMSMSLEEVIRELEEDADDKVLLPRTPITVPKALSDDVFEVDHSIPQASNDEGNNVAMATTWIAEDCHDVDSENRPTSPYRAAGSASPIPRIPGYIPGMPRPMTPRELDSEELRANSTTPRATSPISNYERAMSPISAVSANGMLRRGSNASATRQPNAPISPITSSFASGRYTPDGYRSGEVTELGQPQDSSIIGRRRPVSPLSSSAFQPIHNGSRPGTPSNVTWTVPSKGPGTKSKQIGRNGTVLAHHRAGSSASIADSYDNSQVVGSHERSKYTTRSLRSPAFPDSALIDGGHASVDYKDFQSNGVHDSPSLIPRLDLGSPFSASNSMRSPTPSRSHRNSPSLDGNDALRMNSKVVSPLTTPSSSPFPPRLQSPLIYSPGSNSSSSSLLSTGSSYHSWDEEHPNGLQGITLIGDLEQRTMPWHDFSARDELKSSRGSNGFGGGNSEVILRQNTGLTRTDLALIQGRLVEAAQNKAKNPELRALRRRRPSNAHSIHSQGGRESRTTSPAPQSPTAANFPRPPDKAAKASALLDSVVDSIQDPVHRDVAATPRTLPLEYGSVAQPLPAATEDSSPSRRNKDLADAIFGIETAPADAITRSPALPDSEVAPTYPKGDYIEQPASPNGDYLEPSPTTSEPVTETETTLANSGIIQPDEVLPDAVVPKSTQVDEALLMQVQERTEAAMAQLRKSPSQTRSPQPSGTIHRKRINPQDISSPRLFQSSTSINKIPSIPSPATPPAPIHTHASSPTPNPPINEQRQSSSKIASIMKRGLRGTLRVKNPQPNGEEVSPWFDPSTTPPATQFTRQQTAQNSSPPIVITSPAASSALELNGYKHVDHSPPASAGPSLKGFMARFRKRGQVNDAFRQHTPPLTQAPVVQAHSPVNLASTPRSAPAHDNGTFSRPQQQGQTPVQTLSSPSTPTLAAQHIQPLTLATPMQSPQAHVFLPPKNECRPDTGESHASDTPTVSNQAALQELYKAAENFGLDQSAINELLARSGSSSSRQTAWTSKLAGLTRTNSATTTPKGAPRESSLFDRARSPMSLSDRQSTQTPDLSRTGSARSRAGEQSWRPREHPEGLVPGGNPVVRRTLIFPSGNGSSADLSNLLRKASKSRRRASAQSVQSNRSVHDRAPTPPPPTRAKRFSADASPPVPRLPMSFSAQTQGLLSPGNTGQIGLEKSSSTYESLYDMYAGDRTVSSQGGEIMDRNSSVENFASGDGQAVEVIEMANGETIWSIVNGLRSDDSDSVYQHRISIGSEYSSMSPQDGEAEQQLFFKEHSRNASKGSNTSFLSRKKNTGLAANRPETKVFYSSSAQIARLIESLSRGADAGSFNITPKGHSGHSHTSSLQSETDLHWTVEERLEHMLGSIQGAAST